MTKTEITETALAGKRDAARFIVVQNEGNEVYNEAVSIAGAMADYAARAIQMVRAAEKAMPQGTWSAYLLQEWTDEVEDFQRGGTRPVRRREEIGLNAHGRTAREQIGELYRREERR